jgi:hypothetical protein
MGGTTTKILRSASFAVVPPQRTLQLIEMLSAGREHGGMLSHTYLADPDGYTVEIHYGG